MRLSGAIVTLCLLFSGGPALAAGNIAIHNFLPEFWTFWAAAEHQPVDRQAQLWRELYLTPHQAVFNDLAEPCKKSYDAVQTKYFPKLPGIIPAMHVLADTLPQKLAAARARFLETFPDMRWAGDVYVMASGFCFDGRAQPIQGRSAILFGVDVMASFGEQDLIPVMHHELFHRYHHDFFDYEVSRGYPLWTALWAEGLAVYAARHLNPQASELDMGLVPLGMVQQADGKKAELAADFLARFDSTTEADTAAYFNNMTSKDGIIPPRAGYELGFLVAQELSKQYSIQAMAHWSQQDARPKIREALAAIAGQRT